MDLDAALRRYDRAVRRDAPADGPGARLEHDGCVLRHVVPDGSGWHGVCWSGLDEHTADEAIAAQIRAFTAYGRPFEWKVYAHDRPADLPDRLRGAGFVPEQREAVMVADMADVATEVRLPDGLRLRNVTDPADLDLLVRVHDEVFGGTGTALRPWLVRVLTGAPETVHMVVAMAGDRPVSAARSDLPPGSEFAGLWGGGTLPGWRGRGIYRALVAERARHAAERGYRYLHVDASDDSRPILERLGFHRLTTTTPYVFDTARVAG
ncbi:hypothetical protein N566_16790 [Streptomycetaceae bacterium MP113-05]|nr:hypothetical protein N566_16790 [Streptomycetaceae bacterium MP113-05]